MLMACDLPLPKTILTHAHWTMNKFKMSKSRGNVADPNELLNLVGVEGVRWYLMRHGGNFASDSGKLAFANLGSFKLKVTV